MTRSLSDLFSQIFLLTMLCRYAAPIEVHIEYVTESGGEKERREKV